MIQGLSIIVIACILQLVTACGDNINRRTGGTAQSASAENRSPAGDTGGTKKPDSSKKTQTKNGAKVTASFDLSGQLVSVRPAVHYLVAVDSSGSMADPINQLMISLNKIAQEILAARSSADSAAKDRITILLDLDTQPGALHEHAQGTYETLTYTAAHYGEVGNAITLEFDGTSSAAEVVTAWNEAHPENAVQYNLLEGHQVPSAGTLRLSGGWEVSTAINVVNVGKNVNYQGNISPFVNNPESTLIPYLIEHFQKNIAHERSGTVPHFFVVTDDDAKANQLAQDFLSDARSQYAFSSWAPYNLNDGACETTSGRARGMSEINGMVEAQGHLGVVIDFCDAASSSSPEVIADLIKSTDYRRWVFPEYYWIGENVDFSKPIRVKIDGKLMDPSTFTVIPDSFAFRFKDEVDLIGKSKIDVTFIEKAP